LLYVNELAPVREDLVEAKRAMASGKADVVPTGGSADAYQLSTWRPGNAIPEFSLPFRLARAIRVIPVNAGSQADAATRFDNVVLNIEQCVVAEAAAGVIMRHWQPCGDAESCAACDFRHFCPSPHPHSGTHVVVAPNAP
jgi:hypothetical protein